MVKKLDFSTLMAANVHDMKNIIAAITHAYEALLAQMPEELRRSAQTQLIEQEGLRLDGMLMQLLGLYKLEHNQLRLQAEYHRIDELFEDALNRHHQLLKYRNIEVIIEIDEPDLEGFFDINLLRTVLDNALGNAINHCQQRIILQASWQDNGLLIRINDDGDGYPDSLLGSFQQHETSSINPDSGSTGLGLHFAASIIGLHDQENRPARLELSNGGQLPGACMTIWIASPSLF